MLKPAYCCRKEDGLIVVRIGAVKNRQQHNELSNEIGDLCEAVLLNPEVRVIVLEGTDKRSFVMDTDTICLHSQKGHESHGCGLLAGPIAGLEVPVIAAIRGDAIGQGLELAMACDMRIAAETSRFGLPQVTWGIVPWDGGTQRLSRLVGKGKALEMILTGRIIDAGEALEIGLVNRIVPEDDVGALATALAREMTAKAPIALRYAKEAICAGMGMTLEEGLRQEGDLYLLLQTTRDRTEGIDAFHQKRNPCFEGR